jgi:hypothetical protein
VFRPSGILWKCQTVCSPVVAIAAGSSGKGYWLAWADGDILCAAATLAYE